MRLETIINTYGPHADYMDLNTGYIYSITEYIQDIKSGSSDPKMPVYADGQLIGYIRDIDINRIDKKHLE